MPVGALPSETPGARLDGHVDYKNSNAHEALNYSWGQVGVGIAILVVIFLLFRQYMFKPVKK